MASQNSPEVSQSPKTEPELAQIQKSDAPDVSQPLNTELHFPQTQQSDTLDEPSVQTPSEKVVPESNPENVDTKIDQNEGGNASGSVAEDGVEEASGGAKVHAHSIQKLKDRVSGLQERLRQAGLLEKLEDQNDTNVLVNRMDSLEKILELGDRINSMERKLEEPEHLEDKPSPDKSRLPAIPQLHYVEWSSFKNKSSEEERTYAVEVLIGGAKYYHQRSEEERKSKQRLKDHGSDRDQPITEISKSKSLPERIRINSKPILLIMNEIDPEDRSERAVVMLRPFKPLIYHEARIREVFQRLEAKWGDAERETPTDQAVNSTITTNAGNSTTPAVVNGAVGPFTAKNDAQSKTETVSDDIMDSDQVTVTTSDERVTRRDSISAPPILKTLPLSLLSTNESIVQSPMIEAENHVSEATPESVSKSTRNEETEDLTDSVEALRDIRCLIEFIDLELRPVVDSYRDGTCQKIVFSDLWYLFKPGDLLYSPLGKDNSEDYWEENHPQKPSDRFQEAFRVVCTAGGRPHLEPSTVTYLNTGQKSTVNAFVISVYWVDFSGTQLGSRGFNFFLIPFEGEREINSLQCYPLRHASNAGELKSKWTARGEAFREYMTFKYKYYTGKSLTCRPDGIRRSEDEYPKHAENIDSQVVVDFGEALAAHPGWKTFGGNLTLTDDDAPGELFEDYPTSYWKDSYRKVLDEERDDEIYEDMHIDTKLMEEYTQHDPLRRDHPQTVPTRNGDLDEKYLVLLPNRVFAFVMKTRKWSILTVDGLRPIKRYPGGFNDLQLPMGHKRTIKSLVHNHFINKNAHLDELEASYDADLVRGKGRGLIILLHGAPGVGKTSTAETVADAFGKVLLPITCGDLGLTAANVEVELSEKFHLAELWDCVLLLDEADVFLARRTNTDIKRNSLVSVFLRVLEHFTGILFLTTNRVGAFDEAFKSRIHISLYYPPLDAEKTRDIWKMNLERLSKKKERRNESMRFNEKEIFAYAQNHYTETSARGASWNGRQIRNAFQTASALAEFEAHERNKKTKQKSMETGEVFLATDPQLKVRHFEEIASASYEFDKYISETKGFTDAEIAYQEGQRMDEYRANRKPMRDREPQQTQFREAPAPSSIPIYGPGPKTQRRAAPAAQTSGTAGSGNRQVYVRTPVTFTHSAPEGQDPKYDQPPTRRGTKPVNAYGAPIASAIISRSERPSATRLRPNFVQQQSSYAVHDRERRRHEVFDQDESQREDGDEEEPAYERPYGESFSQPTSTYDYFEDTNQREVSPRRRQVGDLPSKRRKPAVLDYGENLDDDEDSFDV